MLKSGCTKVSKLWIQIPVVADYVRDLSYWLLGYWLLVIE